MPTRLLPPGYQVFDANGAPLPGALLYTYDAGTSTPKASYSDGGLTILNANPIVADSAGRFGNVFATTGDYRLELRTAAGVVIWTADPVAGEPTPAAANTYFNGQIQVFTSAGNYTVPTGITRIKVTCTAGGGSGASCAANGFGGGGGAGGTAIEWITVTPGDVIAVTVGTGGAAPAAGANNGNNGGNSSFGSFCSATGGVGGLAASPGGQGNVATGGNINARGGDGGDGTGGDYRMAGDGGASYFGGGGRGGASPLGGLAGRAPGSGGGGAYDNIGTPAPGGVGSNGIVIVEW